LAGWVANRIDPTMREGDANVAALAARLPAPLVADVAWNGAGAPLPGRETLLRQLGFDAPASS
jgi:dethiobiotin synthetase